MVCLLHILRRIVWRTSSSSPTLLSPSCGLAGAEENMRPTPFFLVATLRSWAVALCGNGIKSLIGRSVEQNRARALRFKVAFA